MSKLDAVTRLAIVLHAGGYTAEREHRFAAPRRWRFDFAIVEHGIAIEVDGGTWAGGRHTTGAGHQTDAEKRNAAARRGWIVLTYNAAMIERGDPLNDLEAIIAHRFCYAEWHRCDGGGPGEHDRYISDGKAVSNGPRTQALD